MQQLHPNPGLPAGPDLLECCPTSSLQMAQRCLQLRPGPEPDQPGQRATWRVEAPLRPEFNLQSFRGYLGEVVACSLSQHRAHEQAGATLVLHQSPGPYRSQLRACEPWELPSRLHASQTTRRKSIPYGACALLLLAGSWDEGVAPCPEEGVAMGDLQLPTQVTLRNEAGRPKDKPPHP